MLKIRNKDSKLTSSFLKRIYERNIGLQIKNGNKKLEKIGKINKESWNKKG